jgi:hypothetical protein
MIPATCRNGVCGAQRITPVVIAAATLVERRGGIGIGVVVVSMLLILLGRTTAAIGDAPRCGRAESTSGLP